MAPIDVLIIDEEEDPFSEVLCRHAGAKGLNAHRSRLFEAARSFTLRHQDGEVGVEPCTPMLLRPVRGGSQPVEVERFAWSECFAMVWAAASLTRAPVINRPSEEGWGCRTALSAAVTEGRAGRPSGAAEHFWLGSAPPPSADKIIFHQSLETWAVVPVPGDDCPMRSRALPDVHGWEQVVVVGGRGWRSTEADIGCADLEVESIEFASRLGLNFATVSWAIPVEGAPLLVRVNPFPSLFEVKPKLETILNALLEELVGA